MKARSGILIFIILSLIPAFLSGQIKDSTWYRNRSNELARIGMQLNREGRNIESLDTFKLVLDYRIKGYGDEDYMLGAAYSAVGVGYFNLGQNDIALKNYKLAEKNYLLRDHPNITSLARLYRNIGNVYRAKLDYNNALDYAMQALNAYEMDDPIDETGIAGAKYAIGELYFLLEDYSKAKEIFNNTYPTTDTLTNIYLSNLMANIEERVDNTDEARYFFLNTISLNKKFYGNNHLELAIAYMNYASFLSEQKEYSEGISTLDKAYKIIQQIQPSKGIELSDYYEYKGDLIKSKPIATENITSFRQQKKQNLDEAIDFYNESLYALYTGEGEVKLDKLTIDNCLSFTDCMILLKTMADTYGEMALLDKEEKDNFYEESLEEALRYYKVIGGLIQRARMEISSDESKIQLTQLEYSTFEKTIETAYLVYALNQEEDYLELAFENSEQLKSSAVFDRISNDLAQENSLIPDSLIELENKLNNIISIYNEKAYEESSLEEPDSTLLQEYNDKVFDATRQRDELNRYLEENYSDYYDLKYSKAMLTVSEIQNGLDKKEAVLEYVLNETDSIADLYTFVITKDSKLFNHQFVTPKMKNSMEYIFNFMTTPNYLFTQNEDSKQFCLSANDMYSLLIQPFDEVIQNKNLTIIPDGKLNYIAFDGLLKNIPDTGQMIDFSKLDYLVRDFNVNYANSVNILMKHRSSRSNLRNRILAFAPEYHSEKFELSNASYTLMPLPGVQKEVDAISETVATDIYRGNLATEEKFRELSSHYDILHLAMHAYINDSLPAYSRLAFAPVKNEEDLQKDGWLNTADVYNLDLQQARLTVLSACNTGVGKMQKGEGLMSLARGFLYAGCPSIVMSLWEVEDNAGTQIMTSFYKNLKHGKTKDEALREAKIEYLENANSRLAHPHYWMSFKSIGDNSPVYTSNDIYFFALLIILIAGFSIDQGLRMKKARRKRQAS